MFAQEPREAREIIGAGALRIAQQGCGQRGILRARWLAPDRHERLLENTRAEEIRRRGIGRIERSVSLVQIEWGETVTAVWA